VYWLLFVINDIFLCIVRQMVLHSLHEVIQQVIDSQRDIVRALCAVERFSHDSGCTVVFMFTLCLYGTFLLEVCTGPLFETETRRRILALDHLDKAMSFNMDLSKLLLKDERCISFGSSLPSPSHYTSVSVRPLNFNSDFTFGA